MILVTGSAGHLGEALMRTFLASGTDAIGVDLNASAFTTTVGSIVDRTFVRRCMSGVDAIVHTATLHKPHVATHAKQDFVDTNITGTLNLLGRERATGADETGPAEGEVGRDSPRRSVRL
jgi:UDP-glucose 4-epimerase